MKNGICPSHPGEIRGRLDVAELEEIHHGAKSLFVQTHAIFLISSPPSCHPISRTPNRSPAREPILQRATSLSTRTPTTGSPLQPVPSSPRPMSSYGAATVPTSTTGSSYSHGTSMPTPREGREEQEHGHVSTSANEGNQKQAASSSSSAAGTRSGSRTRGKQVGDWLLGKTLGAGSMGKVKLATHQYTREKVSTDAQLLSQRPSSHPLANPPS